MPKQSWIGPHEIVGVIGLGLLAVGLALSCGVPMALIVVGGLLFGLAVWPYLVTSQRSN